MDRSINRNFVFFLSIKTLFPSLESRLQTFGGVLDLRVRIKDLLYNFRLPVFYQVRREWTKE